VKDHEKKTIAHVRRTWKK